MRQLSWGIVAIATLALFVLCSCAPSRPEPHPLPIGPLLVFLPPDMDAREIALVASAVRAHLEAFQEEFGEVPPQKVFVHELPLTACGPAAGSFDGCNHLNGTIDVFKGLWDEVPGLYHELAHCYLDSEHRGAAWNEVNEKMGEIDLRLQAERR